MSEKLKKPFYKKWWFWAIVVVLVIGSYGALDEEEKAKSSSPNEDVKSASVDEEPAEETETEKEDSKSNEISDTVVESRTAVFKILNEEYVNSSFDDSKVLALEVEFTNKSGRAVSPWVASATTLKAVQETDTTVETLNGGSHKLPDSYKPELSEMGKSKVKDGKTVKAVIVFDVERPDAPVRLIDFNLTDEPTTFDRKIKSAE